MKKHMNRGGGGAKHRASFPAGIRSVFVLGLVGIVAALALVTSDGAATSRNSEAAIPGTESSLQAEGGPPAVPPSHQKMLTLLQQIAAGTPDNNSYLGDATARALRKRLADLSPDTSDRAKYELHRELGQAELRLGNEEEAIDHLRKAIGLVRLNRDDVPPKVLAESAFWLGVAYMRHGETRNCCLHNSPESCILPLRGGGIHTEQEPSRGAIASFTEVLQITRASEPLHLEARWLLNIAYMTLRGYPEQVPKPYLLSPQLFESEDKIPRFQNIAPGLELDTFDLSGGAIADDFDNDGYLDIVASTWNTAGQIHLFRNNQDGTFSERTKEAGLLGLYGGLNLVQADYDNDGDIDISGPSRRLDRGTGAAPQLSAAQQRWRNIHGCDLRSRFGSGALSYPNCVLGRLRQ